MSQIFCFGDSITYGSQDLEQSGWCARLRKYIDAQAVTTNPNFYCTTYNLGIPGETSSGLLQRFDSELSARISNNPEEKILFIFQFGTNDAAFLPQDKKFRVEKQEYCHNLRTVIEKVAGPGRHILLLNSTPVIDTEPNTPVFHNKVRTNSYVSDYNQALHEATQDLPVELIDVHSAFMKHDHTRLLCSDGFHPNTTGHHVIFTLLQEHLSSVP